MPVLLSPEQAPTLADLLDTANTIGLPVQLPDQAVAGNLHIAGLGALSSAGSSEISFLSNPRLTSLLAQTQAGAVVLDAKAWETYQAQQSDQPGFVPVICQAPYALYAMLAQWFDAHRIRQLPQGIHDTASIDPSAKLDHDVSVGPYAIVEADATIGAGTRVGAHSIVGQGASLGRDCLLHARVTLYHGVHVGDRAILHSGVVLGADGFGFAPDPRHTDQVWVKIAQLGDVRIGNDVEIGANTTVDRGALESTVLGDGVKLDNQIMIAHNVTVGEHTAMAACVGVAGSTAIGARCTVGGAAMLSGHLTVGDDVHISGGTAITSDISSPGRYTGVYPFAEHRQWKKNTAVVAQLSALRRRLRQLEKQLAGSSPQD